MAGNVSFRPPPDSDDSDCSSYDGFYFSEPIKRERVAPYVRPDQKLLNALQEGDLKSLLEEIDALKISVDDVVCGETMLITACREGHYELAAELVNHLGANVNKQVDSITPLMAACDCKAGDSLVAGRLVRLLLDNGAVINVSDKYGMTPFMFACRRGYTNVVRLLINDVSRIPMDNQCCTPLFHAVENNHKDIVKILVEAGFDVNQANQKGYTPKQVAEFHGFYDLLDVLPRDKPTGYVVPSTFLAYNTLRDHIPRIFLKSDCPEYFQEVNAILCSVDMSNMVDYFAKARISLAEFLNMDDEMLAKIGIEFPICRQKILKGILDFHLHHWSKKTIPLIKTEGMDNFYEILMITANHLQHLVIIQAALRFVMQNQEKGQLGRPTEIKLEALKSNLKAYRGVISELTKTVKYLGSFSPPQNPLYIDYNEILAERQRRKVRNVFKYTTIVLGISVFLCLKCKWFA